MTTKEKIYLSLTDKLSAQHVKILDKTNQHVNHDEARKSQGGHYDLTVVSHCFINKTFLERHRMIHQILENAFKDEIHALAIKAYTPEEWDKVNTGK